MSRILIIDDSMFQRFSLAKTVKGLGMTPVEAPTGADGLAVIEASPPEAVILDLNMPGLSGLETLIAIRASHPALPVFILTADIQPTTKTRCEQAGATAFLNKPVVESVLAGLIEQHLPTRL